MLVLAVKKDQELLSTDLGVHAKEIHGPKVNTKNLKTDRAQVPSPTKTPTSPRRCSDPKEFEDNASRIDPPVLRVDRNCMSCAENKAKTLNLFKMACLTHTQSNIPYQGKDYHVSDLLTVKAQIVA